APASTEPNTTPVPDDSQSPSLQDHPAEIPEEVVISTRPGGNGMIQWREFSAEGLSIAPEGAAGEIPLTVIPLTETGEGGLGLMFGDPANPAGSYYFFIPAPETGITRQEIDLTTEELGIFENDDMNFVLANFKFHGADAVKLIVSYGADGK